MTRGTTRLLGAVRVVGRIRVGVRIDVVIVIDVLVRIDIHVVVDVYVVIDVDRTFCNESNEADGLQNDGDGHEAEHHQKRRVRPLVEEGEHGVRRGVSFELAVTPSSTFNLSTARGSVNGSSRQPYDFRTYAWHGSASRDMLTAQNRATERETAQRCNA